MFFLFYINILFIKLFLIQVAFRFIALKLISDVQLCCLCGPTPILKDIEHSATQCFKSSADILTSAVQCHPRNFPSSCQVDNSILGYLPIKKKILDIVVINCFQVTSLKHIPRQIYDVEKSSTNNIEKIE